MSENYEKDRYYDILSESKNISVIYEYIYRGEFRRKTILTELNELVIWIKSEYNNHITLYQDSTNIASNFEFLKSGGVLLFFRANEIVAAIDSDNMEVKNILEIVDK